MSDAEYREMARQYDSNLIWAIDTKRMTPGNMPPREALEAARGMVSYRRAEAGTAAGNELTERYALRAEPLGLAESAPPRQPPARESAEPVRVEEARRLNPQHDQAWRLLRFSAAEVNALVPPG